ncbi:MAG: diguanylate cyclase [Burkholderiaceae bacterium]
MPHHRLKNKLAAPLVILLIVIATVGVIAASLVSSASRSNSLANLSSELASELKVFSGLVAASTEKYEYLPRIVSQYAAISSALADPADARKVLRANLLLERLKAESGATDIFIMDARGNTVAASNWNQKNSFVGNNYAFRPYFFDAMNKGMGRFYAIGITTGVPGYYLAHRIVENNAALGVVAVKVNISSLPVNWVSRSNEIVVADENGIIFLSSRPEWRYRPMWQLTEDALQDQKLTRQYGEELKTDAPFDVDDILNGEERVVIFSSERSWHGWGARRYFVKSQALPGSEWTVHSVASMDSIDEHARMTAYIAFGSAAILVFMLMGLHQFYARGRERKKYLVELERTHRILEEKNRELQALNRELHFHSITDPLTGVFNRRHFMKQTEHLLSLSNRHGFPLSVLMIDVDHFKKINDRHGHPAGDAVLQATVGFIKSELRESDILARWGGEEFIVALPHAGEQEASLVAERIRINVMENTIAMGPEQIAITVSSGVAQSERGVAQIDAAIKRADQALYEAKRNGRNRVCLSSAPVV